MSTLIQCPACSQKFNMQGRLPALFTCTKCQQQMDLTGFPGYVPEEPAAAKRAAAPERGGRGTRRRRDEDEDDDRDERRGRAPAKKDNTPLILGIVGVVVLAVIVVVVMMKKGDPGATQPATPREGGVDASNIPVGEAPAFKYPAHLDPNNPENFKQHRKDGTVVNPDPGASPTPGAPAAPGIKPAEAPKAAPGSGTIKTWPYPDDVTAEERARIDQALDTAVNNVGVDQREAEALLVKLGVKAGWRLVSEFKHLQDTTSFEGRKGKVSAMIVDRILRKIDGFMEKRTGYHECINPESTLEYMTGVAKRWNDWLEKGYYKTPIPPFDPRVDAADEPKEKPAPRGR